MPQQGDEPWGHTSPQAYLVSMLSEKSRHRETTHSEVIFTKILRRHPRTAPCVLAQTQAGEPQREEGQDKHRMQTVVPLGANGGVNAQGGAAWAFSCRGNLLLSRVPHRGSLFYYYTSSFIHLLYRAFTQIKHFIMKRRDLAREYRASS